MSSGTMQLFPIIIGSYANSTLTMINMYNRIQWLYMSNLNKFLKIDSTKSYAKYLKKLKSWWLTVHLIYLSDKLLLNKSINI